MDGIVFKEVRKCLGIGQVVDGDKIEGGAGFLRGANHLATDAAEAVNANFESHCESRRMNIGYVSGGHSQCYLSPLARALPNVA